MQWSRVKSILIILLLLVDGFLACMLGVKAFSAYQRKQENREHLNIVLADCGMKLADGVSLPDDALMPQLNIDRNRADEAAAAAALLGGSAQRTEGEKGSRLTREQGEVVWSETGELTAHLQPEGYTCPELTEVRNRAEQLIEEAGMHVAGMEWTVNGLSAHVSFKTAGYEVFNRGITITFLDDAMDITGFWTFDTPYATKSDLYASYNPIDALLQFAGTGLAQTIYGLEPGLILTNAAGNQFQLSPVWRIRTDTGTYFIDPLKKEVV